MLLIRNALFFLSLLSYCPGLSSAATTDIKPSCIELLTSQEMTNAEGAKMLTEHDVIKLLNLQPLPGEGGFFTETYRSSIKVKVDSDSGQMIERNAGTAIFYLVTPESFSSLHRLKYDEVFHFYKGEPVEMLLIYPDSAHELITLGSDILAGQKMQVVVPAGVWQGTRLKGDHGWALLGTTMGISFEFSDFELGKRATLVPHFPLIEEFIIRYTKE